MGHGDHPLEGATFGLLTVLVLCDSVEFCECFDGSAGRLVLHRYRPSFGLENTAILHGCQSGMLQKPLGL